MIVVIPSDRIVDQPAEELARFYRPVRTLLESLQPRDQLDKWPTRVIWVCNFMQSSLKHQAMERFLKKTVYPKMNKMFNILEVSNVLGFAEATLLVLRLHQEPDAFMPTWMMTQDSQENIFATEQLNLLWKRITPDCEAFTERRNRNLFDHMRRTEKIEFERKGWPWSPSNTEALVVIGSVSVATWVPGISAFEAAGVVIGPQLVIGPAVIAAGPAAIAFIGITCGVGILGAVKSCSRYLFAMDVAIKECSEVTHLDKSALYKIYLNHVERGAAGIRRLRWILRYESLDEQEDKSGRPRGNGGGSAA
jgi:hypothetical protein